ncbi:MAG: GntR family transcriptional regulator [Deltaproteobacteria bacterium]|nr:GntR family transcriptional regulator [Deltaproteobacteria bacterium]MBW1929029.1 GntR family transcriptional regulator [Deltaproteobacteria bacterium]MBW2027101.1 GntR family transcriptional regulator [Deltaproteobacteria bacterium]MBW2127383.1 GntR family transcriptional regulator [Deltaproteobacteria bacterium]
MIIKYPKLVIKNPTSLREKVYRVVREHILNGKIPDGSRIIESRLAKEIGVSRTPVREALHMLEMEGLLEPIPRVGYTVRRIDWDEVEEICEIRKANEVLAGKWAIDKITHKQITTLEQNIRLSEEILRTGKLKAIVDLDAEFHEIIVKASGSPRLIELCQLLRRHMLRYRIEAMYLPEAVSRTIEGHRRILQCIKNKDKKGVESAIEAHLDQARDDIRYYAFEIQDTKVKDTRS